MHTERKAQIRGIFFMFHFGAKEAGKKGKEELEYQIATLAPAQIERHTRRVVSSRAVTEAAGKT